MKVYEVVFDETQDAGVYALSCVDNPAMEDKWLTLADHPKEIQFAAVDEEKRLLLGAALIPNKKIYRKDKKDEYYITFSEQTIEKCAHNFIKGGFMNNSTENHDVKLEGVSVVQSWIVEDPAKDKSANYGKTYEKGTWVTMMKVENDETWRKAKAGELNGFSIDGLFSLKEMNLSTNVNINDMSKQTLADALKEALQSIGLSKKEEPVKLGHVMLKDKKTKVQFEGEELEIGKPVFLTIETEGDDPIKEPMPEGRHELEDGSFLTVDSNGMVTEDVASTEEVKEDESIAAELAEILKVFEANLSKQIEDAKVEMKSSFSAQLKIEQGKTKEAETKLKAEQDKNAELETKLEAKPAVNKIVKTELKVAEPKTAKQRLFNVASEAFNQN